MVSASRFETGVRDAKPQRDLRTSLSWKSCNHAVVIGSSRIAASVDAAIQIQIRTAVHELNTEWPILNAAINSGDAERSPVSGRTVIGDAHAELVNRRLSRR